MDVTVTTKEAKEVESESEFLQMQYVADVELWKPMQYGKHKVSHLQITMHSFDSAYIKDGVLFVCTDVEGRREHFPESNVVKWRIDSHEVPTIKVKREDAPYEYTPYTYPERLGDYLGSYSNSSGCLAFLGSDLQVTMKSR